MKKHSHTRSLLDVFQGSTQHRSATDCEVLVTLVALRAIITTSDRMTAR
ncbi:hypothetical protein LU604_09585 [Erwinia tracheiphila]|nr:hypothetical protein [Erwinia tracheiphila]UIA85077.1 hypothetical protein LU604_09585 [Erwinia tracheiphila]UIA93677.1 hypothetical protein LU632_09545 [Erwinia tracheiphila]